MIKLFRRENAYSTSKVHEKPIKQGTKLNLKKKNLLVRLSAYKRAKSESILLPEK